MATYAKPQRSRALNLQPGWHVIDAEGKTLGRLSSEIAVLLQGKHKPTYVSYLNTGDYVVVVNADKIRVTGNKLAKKIYYRHSGYHGGLREQTLSDLLQKTPTRALRYAVKGMLPKNSLGRRMLSRLKLYAGDSHPHAAQVNARPKEAIAEAPPEPGPESQIASDAPAEATPPSQEAEGAERPRTRRARATSTSKPRAKAVQKTPASAEAQEAGEAEGPRTTRARATSKTRTKAADEEPQPAAAEDGGQERPQRRRLPRTQPPATETQEG